MPPPLPNRLLVEGLKDRWVIPHLIEKLGIPWGGRDERDKWPAEIVEAGGDKKLLREGYISHELKTPGVVRVGMIADADSDAVARWHEIRRLVRKVIPNFPDEMPASGLVHEYDDDGPKRLGVWIMPDNVSTGMLETFLSCCVREQSQGLWPFVVKHCDEAKAMHQAPFKGVHRDKATVHAWLALQDEPGKQLHEAIRDEALKPASPQATLFLSWFCKLFDLPHPAS